MVSLVNDKHGIQESKLLSCYARGNNNLSRQKIRTNSKRVNYFMQSV